MKLARLRLIVLLLASSAALAGGCASWPIRGDRELTARLDEVLTRMDDTGATVSARVLELPSRRVLYARDVDTPYTPASNMKLTVSAAGLDAFGADHSFKTWLALDGDDLWIIGSGDPGFGDSRLANLRGSTCTSVFDDWATALRQRGVTHIPGDLIYYDGALDDQWRHPSWFEDDLQHWYAAPITGLNFNDNCVDITIYPTETGQPVRYEVTPPVRHITVINECVTGQEQEPTIEKLPGGDVYKTGGVCVQRAELKSKPVEDPGAFTADALRTCLASHGITIAGETRRASSPLGGGGCPPAEKTVATHETDLPGILGRINTNSQNLFAEALCKLTGQAYAAREGRRLPGSWSDGERAIRAFMRANGIDDRRYVLADGSGLSDENKVTTRMISDLLAVMSERPDAELFRNSLAEGGVDGTLEERFPDLTGRVFAKTGYISGVRALSGYVLTDSEERLVFSIIYNHIPGSVKPYEELQDEAVRLLSHWPDLPVKPKHYACRHISEKIVIDGRLDEPAWRDAKWTDKFVDIEGDAKPSPRFATRAKLMWDDDFLYIAATMDEPHVWGTLTEHDAIVFRDNDFEAFIDPDGDTREYYEIEINPLNTIFDLFLDRAYRDGGQAHHEWNLEGLETAVHIDGTLNNPSDQDRGWSVEMALPWRSLAEYAHKPAPPKEGDVWRMNFSRVEWRTRINGNQYEKIPDSREGNWVWSPQGAVNMHIPQRWGYVAFVAE